MTEQIHTPDAESETIFVAKLTVKDMKCRPAAPEDGHAFKALARVCGIAKGTMLKANKETGDTHEALVGDFVGTNLSTGHEFRSGVLYLPAGMHEQMVSSLQGKNPTPIEFAVEIRTVASTSKAGYSYQVIPLFKPAAIDPLAKFAQYIHSPKKNPALLTHG